ncbi:MAG: RidA family protein [Desulfovibrio sp.]|jgi:2-iminobutanoate/2-iminopropanoate deaminase|nr:RidA family protein [Desulfovibrio sp.]
MNTLKVVDTAKAPDAIGPYSQALSIGNLIFTSGQLPIDPKTGTMPEDIREQAAISLTNVKNILDAAGAGLDRVIKTTVYLDDIKNLPAVNEVYATFFQKPFPARSCFAVKALPLDAKLEIEVIALW